MPIPISFASEYFVVRRGDELPGDRRATGQSRGDAHAGERPEYEAEDGTWISSDCVYRWVMTRRLEPGYEIVHNVPMITRPNVPNRNGIVFSIRACLQIINHINNRGPSEAIRVFSTPPSSNDVTDLRMIVGRALPGSARELDGRIVLDIAVRRSPLAQRVWRAYLDGGVMFGTATVAEVDVKDGVPTVADVVDVSSIYMFRDQDGTGGLDPRV